METEKGIKEKEALTKTEYQQLRESGFSGFVTIGQLMNDISLAPTQKGVYVILRESPSTPVTFIANGTGGAFKGRNPNVGIEQLEKEFLPDAQILYIGKAGGMNEGKPSKATLQSRLKQYMQFGQGRPIGHWGGRYIWQIEEARDLLVCWKPLYAEEEPREVEKELIANFKEAYGKLPFANLQD